MVKPHTLLVFIASIGSFLPVFNLSLESNSDIPWRVAEALLFSTPSSRLILFSLASLRERSTKARTSISFISQASPVDPGTRNAFTWGAMKSQCAAMRSWSNSISGV